ncbi:VG15 protein [Streptomyces vinaceus]|uniref:VG15 protein n=1 Tax=Streptomyces vinaceus TaxID=1960 RepID=UPI003806B607
MSRSKQAEAEDVSTAYSVALSQIGAETTVDALALWAEVPVEQRAATAGGWLRKAITLVMGRRRQARDLARAYYRLARALQTGTTVADPYHPEPSHVTLGDLRREFAGLAGTYEPPGSESGEAATGEPGEASPDSVGESGHAEEEAQVAPDLDEDQVLDEEGDDWERVLVEEFNRLREDEERIEREAEEELRTVLEALGTENLHRRVSAIDDQQPARDADRQREDAHRQAGSQQAAAAGRVAMNGGRSTTWNHMRRDGRALGYVRLSRTGTPCGWCAMLISRGVAYKNALTAQFKDGDLFHDHCHCYAEPIFSRQQYGSTALFALNREYEALWPKVTKGLSGKSAVSAWRRFIRQKQRAAAQEARRTTPTAQEASPVRADPSPDRRGPDP